MDFFTRQEQSRRATRFLLAAFGCAFIAIALVTTAVAALVLNLYGDQSGLFVNSQTWQQFLSANARSLATAGLIVLGLMILASLYRAATLARGGGQVARMLGATEVSGEDPDPLHRRLVNVVEEMAIASGLPVPEIYVLEQEPGINAFAAGLTHTDAAIAVTRGALERLERDELQGVIAHEFSHILHGDMRLNQQLMGYCFGILVLSLTGRWLLRSTRYARRGRNSGGVMMAMAFGLVLALIGAIGIFFSRIIKAAVSRQREMLADAAAVQFTREPSALAGALKRIGGYTGQLSSVDSEEVAHMLFERGARSFRGLFATHPPLKERILALDPSFKPGDYPSRGEPLADTSQTESHLASALVGSTELADKMIDQAGTMESAAVGQAMRQALPEELHHAAHSRESSFLLVLALAISSEEQIALRQVQLIENQIGVDRAQRCRRLRAELQALDRQLWLPLFELCIPAIKLRPPEQLQFLFDLVERLTRVDEAQRIFDYVLLRLLATYLDELPQAPSIRAAKLRTTAALRAVLATVAAFGHDDDIVAKAAYQAGLKRMGAPPETSAEFDRLQQARDLSRLDASLTVLAKLRPRAKRMVLLGVLATIRHDKTVTIAEIELFRAIAATLGCPLPPAATIRPDS